MTAPDHIDDPAIRAAFAAFPDGQREELFLLRRLILDVAAQDATLGPVTESLKWGQPSYVTRNGTPLRLGLSKGNDPAVFAHCQTTVIGDFQKLFGGDFDFDKNRAVIVRDVSGSADPLRLLIRQAFTYHAKGADALA